PRGVGVTKSKSATCCQGMNGMVSGGHRSVGLEVGEYLFAESGGVFGGGQSAGAATDHNQIIVDWFGNRSQVVLRVQSCWGGSVKRLQLIESAGANQSAVGGGKEVAEASLLLK